MDVIFLDIDGVLNSKDYFIKRHSQVLELFRNNRLNNDIRLKLKRMMLDIDPNKLEILKEIINETGAKVVITSSWKRLEVFPLVMEQLISMGIPIIGATKDNSSDRGKGIRKYLNENNVLKYIILDDDIFDDYDEELLKHLVKTSFVNGGLKNCHKKEAIMKLRKTEVVMDTKKIFEETGKIGNEIVRLKEKIENLNTKYLEITELCPHEIVFKYRDFHPKVIRIDGTYFCPACGKSIRCFGMNQIYDTQFKDSRIIPLTNLSLLGTPEVHQIIRNEVYSNMELYYDPISSIQELSLKMEDILKEHQYQYESAAKVFKKTRRNK